MRRVGAALADQVASEPLARNALELAEKVQLRFAIGIAVLAQHQMGGELVDHLRRPHVAGMDQIEVHRLADDPGIAGFGGADQVRGELKHRVFVERCVEPFLRQLDAIALHAWEADFQCIALRAHCLHLNRFPRLLRRRHHRLGVEVEGNAEHVGVFHVEEVFLIQVVRLAAKRAANDLLAQ